MTAVEQLREAVEHGTTVLEPRWLIEAVLELDARLGALEGDPAEALARCQGQAARAG